MKTSLKFSTFVLLVIVACAHAQTDINDELAGNWQELPLPDSKYGGIHSIGIEPGGTLWTMANNKVYYWDGEQFREPINIKLKSGYYLAKLIGGNDRPLYATQTTQEEHQGKLYELTDGEAVHVTDFYFDSSGDRSCVYVSKSGRLFNWGKRFLAFFKDDKWDRIEARLAAKPLIFEHGESVYFYYNGNLYCVDPNSAVSMTKIPSAMKTLPGQTRTHGALWGNDKILLISHGKKNVFIYDFIKGVSVNADWVTSYLEGRSVYDLFTADDGAVWLLIHDRGLRGYVLLRIQTDGHITMVEDTLGLGWNNVAFWQYPKSVLSASDGSIWFATQIGAIGRYSNEKLTVYNWRSGVSFGQFRHICEDLEGTIYAASYEAIYALRRGESKQQEQWVNRWTEYELTDHGPHRDNSDNIWMFLKEKPGNISRWNGIEWNHIDVPFDTSKSCRMMTDDRGHILIDPMSHSKSRYDISSEGISQYEDLQSMVLGAANRGARHFLSDYDFLGCIVLDGPRIWFGYYGYERVYYFDGENWDELQMGTRIDYLYKSPRYGMVLLAGHLRFFTYDTGQFVKIASEDNQSGRWLLGPRSLQPYEEELLELRPKQYLPVKRSEDGKVFMLVPKTESTPENRGDRFVVGPELNRDMRRIKPGYIGGFWSAQNSGTVFRLFGNKVLPCDWRDTPLLARANDIRQVLDDSKGNLWIDAGWYAGARHVFVQRMQDFVLRTEDVSAEAIRSLTISAQAFWGDEAEPKARLFWRFKGGYWQGGEVGVSVTIDFPEDGTYRIELIAMAPQGGITPKPLSFTVKAATGFPETIATEGGPYTAEDVLWKIPARAATSKLAAGAKLVYRINEGQRKPAYKGNMVEFGSLEAGKYSVEVTACEEGKYYDPAPLVFEVTYAPNYERIVESRIDDILSDDNERAEQAMSEVKTAGIAVMAVLEEWIGELEHEDQHRQRLERLLREIQNQKQMLHERERNEWWRGSRGG